MLRTAQFAEDAGPMAHPVRPDSYMEINNFYTATVYEKGAEVVRMIHTLLGAEAFRRGADLYFDRHDGQAVTCEDFVSAMEDASGVDLGQFRNWYSQAGTPRLEVSDAWEESTQRYTLTVEQSCPPTPGQSEKKPLVIPLAIGLIGAAGSLPLRRGDEESDLETADNTHTVLKVTEPSQTFVFEGVAERPVPSLLRGFSAPVRLDYDYSPADLCALMSRDDDGFVRWDSAQTLATRVIQGVQSALEAGDEPAIDPLLVSACANLLEDTALDPAMVAGMLTLPGENYLAELAAQGGGIDVDGIHSARQRVTQFLGGALEDALLARYRALTLDEPYAPTAGQIATRSLRNTCLALLVHGDDKYLELASQQYDNARSMTDRLAALRVIAFYGDDALRDKYLERFHSDWRHEVLVVNQWLQVQAAIPDEGALARVQALMEHEDFDLRNPNKVRALLGVFSTQNPVNFHRVDGAGYRLLADVVLELNTLNPQIAAGLLTPLTRWRDYLGRSELMNAELLRLAATPSLSPDVYEVVDKSLR